MLRSAQQRLTPAQLAEVTSEISQALALPDDEATLVLATIKSAWQL
jgi:hypothetical protein